MQKPWTPGNVLGDPQTTALQEELQYWDIVSTTEDGKKVIIKPKEK